MIVIWIGGNKQCKLATSMRSCSLCLLACVGDTAATTPTENVTESPPAVSPPFYTQAPFIVGVVVLCLLLLFLCFVGLLCFVRPSGPYSPSTNKFVRADGTMRASWSPGSHDLYGTVSHNRVTLCRTLSTLSTLQPKGGSLDSCKEVLSVVVRDSVSGAAIK